MHYNNYSIINSVIKTNKNVPPNPQPPCCFVKHLEIWETGWLGEETIYHEDK